MKRIIILFVVFQFFTTKSFAQKWLWGTEGTVTSNNISGECEGLAVASDPAGNSYLTGYFVDTIILGSYYLTTNSVFGCMFIAKYDTNGNVLWINQAKNNNINSSSKGLALATDASGNVYVTGNFDDTLSFDSINLQSPLNSNTFLVKYDANGHAVWAKQSGTLSFFSSGISFSVATDKIGNAYITGIYNDTINFGAYSLVTKRIQSIFYIKYDPSGNVLWAKQPDIALNTLPLSISLDHNNNIFITGEFADTLSIGTTLLNSNENDAFLIKLDSNGDNLWAKQSISDNLLSKGIGYAYSVAVDKGGNSYLTGLFTDSINFDSYKLVTKKFKNIFLVKYDTIGNVIWARSSTVLKSANWVGWKVVADTINNVYIVGSGGEKGSSGDEIAFGTDTISIDSLTYDGNSIIVKFDTSGNVLCSVGINGGGDDNNAIAVAPSGKYIYFGGDLWNAVRFDPDSLLYENTEVPFMAKWQPCLSSNATVNTSNEISCDLYPNPNNGQFILTISSLKNDIGFEIYDILGQKIYSSNLISEKSWIGMMNPVPGIYLYEVIDMKTGTVCAGKFIVAD